MNQRQPNHLNLLFDMGEVFGLVSADSDITTFLDRTVNLVATHLKAHVCSIYLFEEAGNRLVLKATRGLNPGAVDTVWMKPGEGLVGQCFETLSIVREGNASKNPKFKYFDQAGEDPFNSFLCVPILRGAEKIGVLVVQHKELDHFTRYDAQALKTIVAQVGGAVGNARLLMALDPGLGNDDPKTALPPFIKGEFALGAPISGRAQVLGKNRKSILHGPGPDSSRYSKDDFLEALSKTTREMKSLQAAFAQRLPESAAMIFTAHFMILKDKKFIGKMTDLMDRDVPAVTAVKQVSRQYIDLFAASPNTYMQEKAVDVEDLAIRILSHLETDPAGNTLSRGRIAVAPELYPSDILKLAAAGTRGIVLAGGGAASHVTILCRSLKMPLLMADDTRLLNLPDKTPLLLDTVQKNLYINPSQETLDLFSDQKQAREQAKKQVPAPRTLTRDREAVHLLANINLLSEASLASDLNAEGIGLYRTEFPFLIRKVFPSEEEQFLIYRKLFDCMPDKPVTVRTLDAGGEKTLSYSGMPKEANPELGLRSIRFSLRFQDVFKAQVRAILRAAHGRDNIRIMFPLIASIDEFMAAKTLMAACTDELTRENIPHNPALATGMMIELPSVLPIIDEFAELSDFFSVGTNDFVQYMLGADRANTLVAAHYIPHHPAVNRGLDTIAKAAQSKNIPVTICGEMAHNPDYIPFLLGIGIRHLSIDPQFLNRVQETVTSLSIADCQTYAQNMLAQTRVADAQKLLDNRP